MRITEMNWMDVEARLAEDPRVVLPLGSVEQHAYLSLATDAILAERVAVDAAGPLGIPVYPAQPYGLARYFSAYPGTIHLREETYAALMQDLLSSLYGSGFRRILLVNGHGGNAPAGFTAGRWARQVNRDVPEDPVRVQIHHWWRAPRTRAAVDAAAPHGSHANWMENFPWTRLPGRPSPDASKPPVSLGDDDRQAPERVREILGDGSFGGAYQVADEVMEEIWRVAVEETRERLADGAWSGPHVLPGGEA